MIQLIRQNRIFYTLCLLWFIAGGIYLLTHEKGDLSIWLNGYRTSAADHLFRYITWLGDGIVISAICILLVFVKYRYAVITSIVSFVSAFLVNILKNIFNEPRPVEYFAEGQVRFVERVELYHWLSFPSGHTAAAFALMSVMSFFAIKKSYTVLFFFLALLVAISRVYLLQHFFIDVYFGALAGCVNALVIYYLMMHSRLFSGKQWHEGSLLKKNVRKAG